MGDLRVCRVPFPRFANLRTAATLTVGDGQRGAQSYAWILELLGEALVQHDEVLECEHNPQLSLRNTAGIHQAIRIISRLASEQRGKMIGPDDLSDPAD